MLNCTRQNDITKNNAEVDGGWQNDVVMNNSEVDRGWQSDVITLRLTWAGKMT